MCVLLYACLYSWVCVCEIFHSVFCSSIVLFVCFHFETCIYINLCVYAHIFFAWCLLFKLNEKHRHTELNDTNSQIRSMGNERFSVYFLLLSKNSFMIYDLLSIMRTLSLNMRAHIFMLFVRMFRFIAFFNSDIYRYFLTNFLALWDT